MGDWTLWPPWSGRVVRERGCRDYSGDSDQKWRRINKPVVDPMKGFSRSPSPLQSEASQTHPNHLLANGAPPPSRRPPSYSSFESSQESHFSCQDQIPSFSCMGNTTGDAPSKDSQVPLAPPPVRVQPALSDDSQPHFKIVQNPPIFCPLNNEVQRKLMAAFSLGDSPIPPADHHSDSPPMVVDGPRPNATTSRKPSKENFSSTPSPKDRQTRVLPTLSPTSSARDFWTHFRPD